MSGPDETNALTSVRDLVRWGASSFVRAGLCFGHGTDNALDEAFHLVLWSLGLPHDVPAVYLESAVTASEREQVVSLLRARVETRRPAAYLTGEAWFAGLAFHVDEHVLVPRSPIAELIRAGYSPWVTTEPQRVLDLCTGSGCIGIATAFAFEEARVDCSDLDPGALAVCVRNIERHGLSERVRALRSDLFAQLPPVRYDLIVSNPPYVPSAEVESLAAEYRHEPRSALEAGEDGLLLVDRILREAPEHMTPAGVLICEVGGSAAAFQAAYPDLPVIWPEFQHGGDGVFVVGREDLRTWQRSARGVA